MAITIALIDDEALGLGRDPILLELRQLADRFTNAAAATSVLASTDGNPQREAPQVEAPRVEAPPVAAPAAPVGFVAPKAIRQTLPRFPVASAGLTRSEGEIAVDVAADGSVTAARITVPLSSVFDALLVDAAKQWRYEPARRLGVPVPYTVRVRVKVTHRN
jgi:TonB family protein